MNKFINILRWVLFIPIGIFIGVLPKLLLEYFFPVYYPIMIGNFNILNIIYYFIVPFICSFLYIIMPSYIVPKFKFMISLLVSFIMFIFITYFIFFNSFYNNYFLLSYISSIFGISVGIFHVRKFSI